jgi:hypothetical protein
VRLASKCNFTLFDDEREVNSNRKCEFKVQQKHWILTNPSTNPSTNQSTLTISLRGNLRMHHDCIQTEMSLDKRRAQFSQIGLPSALSPKIFCWTFNSKGPNFVRLKLYRLRFYFIIIIREIPRKSSFSI